LELRQRNFTNIGSIAVVISVIAMIGVGPLKMRQTKKRTTPGFGAVPNSGFAIVKNPPKLIQIPPTIFHPTLGNNY
jgi:hypothetical protein